MDCEAGAELVANVTVRPARGQELLLDLGERSSQRSGIVHVRAIVVHALKGHASHGVGVYREAKN